MLKLIRKHLVSTTIIPSVVKLSTLGQTAMKGLFAEAKASNPNQTLAPEDGSVERIFGTPAKTFEHYVTPKKTPNPFDADVKIVSRLQL